MCGQFITNNVGFSALIPFTRPEMKGQAVVQEKKFGNT